MSRKRQVSFPLRREHDVHFESLASLYAVARQNLSCIIIRRPSSEDAAGCVRSPQGKYDLIQGRTHGSRVNQIWCALRGMPLQRRERQSARVSFLCFWGLALLVGKGKSACVTGGRCGARQDEDAARCGYAGPRLPATTTWPAGLCSTT
jgi:hypothetical protein